MIRSLYDWVIRLAAHPRALWALAVVSFMESSFFPIPPDVMLAPMILARPQKAYVYAAVCTVASVLGGLFGYSIGYFLYDSVGQWMLSALGLAEGFPRAACYLRENAFWLIVAKGATPIPFKLVTITSGFVGVNLHHDVAHVGGNFEFRCFLRMTPKRCDQPQDHGQGTGQLQTLSTQKTEDHGVTAMCGCWWWSWFVRRAWARAEGHCQCWHSWPDHKLAAPAPCTSRLNSEVLLCNWVGLEPPFAMR